MRSRSCEISRRNVVTFLLLESQYVNVSSIMCDSLVNCVQLTYFYIQCTMCVVCVYFYLEQQRLQVNTSSEVRLAGRRCPRYMKPCLRRTIALSLSLSKSLSPLPPCLSVVSSQGATVTSVWRTLQKCRETPGELLQDYLPAKFSSLL